MAWPTRLDGASEQQDRDDEARRLVESALPPADEAVLWWACTVIEDDPDKPYVVVRAWPEGYEDEDRPGSVMHIPRRRWSELNGEDD